MYRAYSFKVKRRVFEQYYLTVREKEVVDTRGKDNYCFYMEL